MATPVYPTMNPAAQDALQVLLVKAAYYAQVAVEASGGPFMPGFYPNMTPFAQDPLQVVAAKLAWWLSQLGAGGGGGLGGLTNGAGVPPVDGSVTTLFYRNTLTGQKYMNVGTVAVPAWEAI